MARFLPRLRAIETKDVPRAGVESKVILSAYYAAIAASGIGLPGRGKSRQWDVERAVAEAYSRVVWCFKPVQVISGNSAMLPFRLRQDATELDDHPLYRVLNQQANPLETAQVFRKRLSAQVLLSPRGAFIEVTESNAGDVLRMDLLPPGRTRPVPGTGSDPISHFEVTDAKSGEKRGVDVERVRWVRDPHPLNPYLAITPLEAAGLSIELDYYARLYNVSFMQNDGRPGGILGVKPPESGGGEMDEEEMNRLEARFGKGPVEAGKLSVISGDLKYVDVASRPRDMQYKDTSLNARKEIIVAFGVPESQMGDASGKTFANADAEGYAFWTQTMAMHNSIILAGFDSDSEDDLEGYFDTEKIEVLQRPLIARREEARGEVAAGLRSILSYMTLAGLADEVEDTAVTRALWQPAGRTPIPSREADAEALGLGGPGAAPDVPVGGQNGGEGDTAGSEPVVAPTPGDAPDGPGADGGPGRAAPTPPTGTVSDMSLFGDATLAQHPATPRRRVHLAVARESKSAPDDSKSDPTSTLDERLAERTEQEVADALDAFAVRLVERAVARLNSPRERKGTRHWQPEYDVDLRVGTKALDAPRIAGEDDDSDRETGAVRRVLDRAGATAAAQVLRDLTGSRSQSPPARALARVNRTVDRAMRLVNGSVALQRQRLADTVNRLDQAGQSVEQITVALRALGASWAEGLAVQATTATLEGARDDAVGSLSPAERADVTRTWVTRRDTTVREAHRAADGQKRPLGHSFLVGGAALRYPGDPDAPVALVANCRCRVLLQSKASGRFVRVPGERTRRPALATTG